jgi:hypothetical protein
MNEKITLVKDTIDINDVNKLIDWLKTNPRLTKGDLTIEFEKKWSEWLGTKYSVFVNSGSSANLAAIYSLILSGKLKNNKIIVPAVSWVTTVTPAIQLGLEPIMCECDMDNLDELLRYADRNSMAHSIEVRLPFLFHELVEFVFTLPIDYIYRDGKTKFILRETAKNYLPEKIYSRTDKIGFAPPEENWLDSQNVKLELKNADKLLQVNSYNKSKWSEY